MNAFMKHRHIFRFKVQDGQVLLSRAKVRPGRQKIRLVLKPEHVRESMALHGVGNTQTCSMAQCVKANQKLFPHPFIGIIDWQDSRCYVASKRNQNHQPSECYGYLHDDTIAKLNDSPGGQKELLEDLLKHGPKVIDLRPMRQRSGQSGGGGSQYVDGSRTSRPMGYGARLRYARAKLGGFEDE